MKNIYVFLAVVGFLFSAQVTHAIQVACTADAKLCPDGSYVGRSGPSCAFAACPNAEGDIPPVELTQCLDIKNNLFLKSKDSQTNGEVSDLQDFLSPRYFSVEPTGYFGRTTLASVQAFQRDNGLKAFGYVGPATRAKIRTLSCGGAANSLSITLVEPNQGRVGETITVYGYGLFQAQTKLSFDGMLVNTFPVYTKRAGNFDSAVSFTVPEAIFQCPTNPLVGAPCTSRPVTPGSTYALEVRNEKLANGYDVRKFYVTPSTSTTKPSITSISPAQGAVGTDVVIQGNGINVGGDKIYFGNSLVPQSTTASADVVNVLRFKVPTTYTPCGYDQNIQCRMAAQNVTPGNYEVRVVNSKGVTNAITFTVVTVNVNQPIISGVSGPQTLSVNQQGTWTVTASNSNGGNLSYSVVWGDEGQSGGVSASVAQAAQQTATFNKSYSQTGTYSPRFTVTNSNGQSVSASLSVNVTNTSIQTNPSISSISPTQGVAGISVILRGSNMNVGDDKVYFAGRFVIRDTNHTIANEIKFTVPATYNPLTCIYSPAPAVACPSVFGSVNQNTPYQPGVYKVWVSNNRGNSNEVNFTITQSQPVLIPTISSLTPTAGAIGSRVTVYGSNIDTATEYILMNGYRVATDGSKVAGQASFIVPEELSSSVCSGSVCSSGALLQVLPGTYTIQAGNANGVSNTLSFNVISFGIENPLISKFQVEDVATTNSTSRRLVWATQFASSCTASGAWSGTQAVNGSYSIGFMLQPMTYTLTCVNSQGASVTRSVNSSNVTPNPTTFSIASMSPANAATGASVIISGQNISYEDTVMFGSVNVTVDQAYKTLNQIRFNVPLTVFQCPSGSVCTDVFSPTPIGMYNVSVVNNKGIQSNTLQFQVTSN